MGNDINHNSRYFNGNWKIALIITLCTGLGCFALFYLGNLEGRLDANSRAIEENRKLISDLRTDIAELKSDVSNIHARLDHWNTKIISDIEKTEDKIDELKILFIESKR